MSRTLRYNSLMLDRFLLVSTLLLPVSEWVFRGIQKPSREKAWSCCLLFSVGWQCKCFRDVTSTGSSSFSSMRFSSVSFFVIFWGRCVAISARYLEATSILIINCAMDSWMKNIRRCKTYYFSVSGFLVCWGTTLFCLMYVYCGAVLHSRWHVALVNRLLHCLCHLLCNKLKMHFQDMV